MSYPFDTIDIDIHLPEFEDSQLEGFLEECNNELKFFQETIDLLKIEDVENYELNNHGMATLTLYKDLFRVQLDKLLHELLLQEISKLNEETDIEILTSVNLDNISKYLENDIFLDGTQITNEDKNVILNVLKKINLVLTNWEFLSANITSSISEDLNIKAICDTVKNLFTENISTFLGENIKLSESSDIKLAERFINEYVNHEDFSDDELARMKDLIQANGFRKIEFGYSLDFKKLKDLIYSAIRCKNQLSNEREDIELMNLVVMLQSNFRDKIGAQKVIEDVRAIYENRPEVLAQIDAFSDLTPFTKLVEVSPPIYTQVQHNLMYRVYEQLDDGIKVTIYSLPYDPVKSQRTLENLSRSGKIIQSFPVSSNSAFENNLLANLVSTELNIEDVLKQNPTIESIGIDTIKNNDSVINPILDELTEKFGTLVDQVVNKLPLIVTDKALREQYIDIYEDIIRAIDLKFKDRSKIETTLSEDQIEKMQADVLDKVMSGQSLSSAIVDIVGKDDFTLKTRSEGDCVAFETNIGKTQETSGKSVDLSGFKNGTILTTQEVSANGFKSRITEKVIDGEKVHMVTCLVCQREFDTCNEKCPECSTERALQYKAIYEGDTKDGKAAINYINNEIKKRETSLRKEFRRPLVKNITKPVDSALGQAVEGMFTGFLNVITFGLAKEPNYTEG